MAVAVLIDPVSGNLHRPWVDPGVHVVTILVVGRLAGARAIQIDAGECRGDAERVAIHVYVTQFLGVAVLVDHVAGVLCRSGIDRGVGVVAVQDCCPPRRRRCRGGRHCPRWLMNRRCLRRRPGGRAPGGIAILVDAVRDALNGRTGVDGGVAVVAVEVVVGLAGIDADQIRSWPQWRWSRRVSPSASRSSRAPGCRSPGRCRPRHPRSPRG